ncbi:MAG: CBS domain-containing protein [Lewinellaceae bacterium]|nr:CBS domain-containing protein [Lewinellaceae bacterium]
MMTNELCQVKVEKVMSSKLVTVNRNTTLEEIESIMNTYKIHHVPVVEQDNVLVGLISQRDILLLRDWSSQLGHRAAIVRNDALLKSTLAEDVMKTKIMNVSKDDSLVYCADIFRENLFQALPVVEDGIIIGIITTYDLIDVAYN